MIPAKALVPRLLNKGNRLITSAQKGAYVAHHGIQRSGTNCLPFCMRQCGIRLLNQFDPERNHPKHKHFRWQDDKASIPWFIREQYGNAVTVNSVDELNAAAGYPASTRHIVVRKKKLDWPVSITNWGIRVVWFEDKANELGNISVLALDYEAYY